MINTEAKALDFLQGLCVLYHRTGSPRMAQAAADRALLAGLKKKTRAKGDGKK